MKILGTSAEEPCEQNGVSAPGPKRLPKGMHRSCLQNPPGQDVVRAHLVQEKSKPQRDLFGNSYSMFHQKRDTFYKQGYWSQEGSDWPEVILLDRTSPGQSSGPDAPVDFSSIHNPLSALQQGLATGTTVMLFMKVNKRTFLKHKFE